MNNHILTRQRERARKNPWENQEVLGGFLNKSSLGLGQASIGDSGKYTPILACRGLGECLEKITNS